MFEDKLKCLWSTLDFGSSEGLGVSSQNTIILVGVTQILIYLRSSPSLADVRLFAPIKSQQSPLGQRVSRQTQLFLNERSNTRSRSRLLLYTA